jgi:uncharacterized protein (TIGR02145 family)
MSKKMFFIYILIVMGCINAFASSNQYVLSSHNGIPTIKSPTGQEWMAYNLGASRICESIDDEQCFGDYYQWGRNADGHEKLNSELFYDTINRSKYNKFENGEWVEKQIQKENSNGNFIVGYSDCYWWSDINDTVDLRPNKIMDLQSKWNVCPNGFKIPDIDNFLKEKDFFNNSTPSEVFQKLKIPTAGYRTAKVDANGLNFGIFGNEEIRLWTRSIYSPIRGHFSRQYQVLYNKDLSRYVNSVVLGRFSVAMPIRCIKN